MKNLFFALAFMLIGVCTYANNGISFNEEFSLKAVSQEEMTEINLSFDSEANFNSFDVNEMLGDSQFSAVLEHKFIDNTCYARFCWNASETQRECTDWQEIPCGTEIEVEAMPEDDGYRG